MKKLILSALVAAFALFGVSEAQAQGVQFGVGGAYGFSSSDLFADVGPGIEGRVGIPIEAGFGTLKTTGSFGYFFPSEDFTYWEINGNLAYMFEAGTATPYAGAGLNFANFSNGGSFNEIGLNLLGGVEFSAGALNPYLEGAFQLSGGEQIMIKGGLLFGG